MRFVSLEELHSPSPRLRPGEAISVFAHNLKKLLDMAIPGMNKEARDHLLLHQFMSGLPEPIMKQLRASGEVKTLEAAITCSQLLMTIDSQCPDIQGVCRNEGAEKPSGPGDRTSGFPFNTSE